MKFWFGVQVANEAIESVAAATQVRDPVPRHKRHVTVLFCGQAQKRLQELKQVAAEVAPTLLPWTALVSLVPQVWRNGVVSLPVTLAGFRELHKALQQKLQIRQDYPYVPHITLGRGGLAGTRPTLDQSVEIPVFHFGLYSSGYEKHGQWRLGK